MRTLPRIALQAFGIKLVTGQCAQGIAVHSLTLQMAADLHCGLDQGRVLDRRV
jgi:hypothetical protein